MPSPFAAPAVPVCVTRQWCTVLFLEEKRSRMPTRCEYCVVMPATSQLVLFWRSSPVPGMTAQRLAGPK